MPPDRTPADREPAHRADGGGAGSVVVGLDPSTPAGISFARAVDPELLAERLNTLNAYFEHMREGLEEVDR